MLALTVISASAQWRYRFPRFSSRYSTLQPAESDFVKKYSDSLTAFKQKLISIPTDSFSNSHIYSKLMLQSGSGDIQKAKLFIPVTFYHGAANRMLNLTSNYYVQTGENQIIDNALMYVYLNRPDLVETSEDVLDNVGPTINPQPSRVNSGLDIVHKLAPVPMEPEFTPVSIVVKKPNFWTFYGDYYMQFLQNYVSCNWYKGGKSNYSMVGSVTMQFNYNNKQKVKLDNKLELKLGYQTTKGDTIHKYKTSEDLIRYTGKLGLQASKKWYYTLQLIAYTQFAHGLKSNDSTTYSDFMSPFNLNLSVGMDYTVSWFNQKLTGTAHMAPLACNFKYVDRVALATRYGIDVGSHTLIDYGSEITLDLSWKLSDMINWKARWYGYTTYKRTEMEWENTFTFQFNKYISTNLFVYPRFDDGASSRDVNLGYWQFKEYASLGFSYSF